MKCKQCGKEITDHLYTDVCVDCLKGNIKKEQKVNTQR